MHEAEIERITFTYFPELAVRDLMRAVFVARREAWFRCRQEFEESEAENLRPFDARARLEGLMRGVADRHGIQHEVIKQDGGAWNHTELSNGLVILTAATVQSPLELVDPSDYRMTLASDSQLKLAPFEEPAPEDGRLYALLLHSRSRFKELDQQRDYGFLPGSVYLAYPNPALDHYRHWINLFDKFPQVVKAETPEEWNEESLRLYIERSRRVSWPRRFKAQ